MLNLRQQSQNNKGLPCDQKWLVIGDVVGGNGKGHQQTRCDKAKQSDQHIRMVSSRKTKEARIGGWHGKRKKPAHKKSYQNGGQDWHPELCRIHQDFTEQHVVNAPCQKRVDHKGGTSSSNESTIWFAFNINSTRRA